MKSDKTPSIIYAGLQSLIKKLDNCKNNPEKSSKTRIGEYIPGVHSMSAIGAFDALYFSERICS